MSSWSPREGERREVYRQGLAPEKVQTQHKRFNGGHVSRSSGEGSRGKVQTPGDLTVQLLFFIPREMGSL